jgi:DNA topoisomerase II
MCLLYELILKALLLLLLLSLLLLLLLLQSMFFGAEDPKAKGAKGAKAAAKGKKPAKKTAKNADNNDEDEDEEAGTGKGGKKQPAMYVKDFRENHTDTTVHFTVTMAAADLDYLEEQPNGLRKFFKLQSSITTSNMTMFDEAGTIAQYQSPLQVLSEFYGVRLRYYGLRKAHLLAKLQREWSRLDNKVRFVLAVVGGTLEVRNRKKSELLQQLRSDGFDPLLPETGANGRSKVKPVAAASASEDESGSSSESEEDSAGESAVLAKGYDYLLGACACVCQ